MKRKFDYALTLVEALKKKENEFTEIKIIAAQYRLPAAYLEKIAQELKKAGWLESRKGAGGGYRLVKGQAYSVQSLINLFEPIYTFCPVLRNKK